MFFVRKIRKGPGNTHSCELTLPMEVSGQLGLSPGDDVHFEFKSYSKEVVLTKSPYDIIRPNHAWTKEEVELLKNLVEAENLKRVNINAIMERLNRSYHSVRTKLGRLGIALPLNSRSNFWSPGEIQLLTELSATTSNPELAKRLRRSERAIAGKKSKLHLRRTGRQVKHG